MLEKVIAKLRGIERRHQERRTPLLALAALLSTACAHRTPFVASDETLGSWGRYSAKGADVAADGSWVVLGLEEPGDPPPIPLMIHGPPPYRFKLLLPSGRSIRADDHHAAPGDRHVVVVRDGRLVLVDVANERETDMMPQLLEDGLEGCLRRGTPAALSSSTMLFDTNAACYFGFSDNGRTVAWMESGAMGYHVVARDLEDGSSHTIHPGPGIVTRMRPMPDGDAVMLSMFVEGDPPDAVTPPIEPRPGSKPRWSRWPALLPDFPFEYRCTKPDKLAPGVVEVTRVFALDGRELDRRGREYVPMGRDLVRPADHGGLWWWTPDQRERTHVPVCDGEMIHVDRSTGQMLLLCDAVSVHGSRADFTRGRLVLQTSGDQVDLGQVSLTRSYPERGTRTPHVVLDAIDGPIVVDLDARTITPLPRHQQVLAIAGGTVLMRRTIERLVTVPRRVQLFDLATREVVDSLTTRVAPWSRVMGTGSIVTLDRWMFDLEAGRVLGKLPSDPLGVTDDGRALLFDPRSPDEGPFRWYSARRG